MDAPHSLRPNRWQAGWQDNARLHEAVEWYDIETSFDEVITCLLERIPVAAGLDWWGHLVCFLDPVVLPDGSVGVLFQNSWGEDWPTPGRQRAGLSHGEQGHARRRRRADCRHGE